MSVFATSWVWEHSRSKGTARLVLLALADHAGSDGGDSYPSVGRLACRCGVSKRTVQEALKMLVSLNELTVDQQAGPHGANRYQLAMTPADLAPPQILHPADSARPPRRSRTPPMQILQVTPADSAPEPSLTVIEPSLNRQSLASDLAAARTRSGSFDDFWAAYPLRKAKGEARTAWAKALKKATASQLIAGAVAYAEDPNRDPEFTKYPATWLNKGCWDDEPAKARLKVSKSTKALAAWAAAT